MHCSLEPLLEHFPLVTSFLGRLARPHSLEHPELEFSGPSQGDGLAASPGFINVIGDLLPMAPGADSSCSLFAKPPTFRPHPQCQEPMSVRALGPEAAVEGLNEDVVGRRG